MEQPASKRKQPSSSQNSDRPHKQARRPITPGMDHDLAPRLNNGVHPSQKDTPDGYSSPDTGMEDGSEGSVNGENEADHLASLDLPAADSAEWQAMIEKVVRNVVSIHFCQTHSFDTDGAISSEATGFVVDAERGYILTNRHVVGAGPFWGYCIFDNHEECDVHAVYRDPVHDFGILRFDPKAIKYMPLASLELRPDLAKVGVEIRVVGNDAGEKLSILSGVISRLDRNAPEYGEGYSDFNTNYIQAAAAASGGSSGSPVVNIDGYAVALQAGGRADGAATDYFLPLDRPLRALKCIQEGRTIDRGTIQTQWILKAFDECRRLGLTSEWEGEIRKQFPKETGMLVAEVVLPMGPAHKHLEEGDVLVKVNGELLTQFIPLDDILDSNVGKKVKLMVLRGGQPLEVELDVGNLHDITPDRFVSVAGASFHSLSYQQARLYAVALKDAGVYCCEASGSFRLEGAENGWLIQSIDQKPTPDLDTFIEVMKNIPDRARVVVTYKHLRDMHTTATTILFIDRHWHKNMRMAIRNDETGLWDFTDLSEPLPPQPLLPKRANFAQMAGSKHPAAVDIIRSFVRVTTTVPVKLDGFPRARKVGFGLVIDAEQGLVIVSRAIVPYDMCDITITIADSIIIPGKIVFLHPLQNYAIVQYDPELVNAPVKAAQLSETPIKQGEETIFFGFNHNLRAVSAKTAVTDITTVTIPASAPAPRYRAVNLDAITVDTPLSSECGSGVLVSPNGVVQALWLTYLGDRSSSGRDTEYHLGCATPPLLPVINAVRAGEKPDLRILGLETQTMQMAQCRIMGVSEDWIERVEAENPARHQLFMVRKVDASPTVNASAAAGTGLVDQAIAISREGADARITTVERPQASTAGTSSDATAASKQNQDAIPEGKLIEGDVLLTLNDKLITNLADFDIMYTQPHLTAVLVRQQQELTLRIPTRPTIHNETSSLLVFCGALLHAPHHAVRQQISKAHSEIYVSGRGRGSPAYAYGLAPTNFILAVNGVPTQTLPEFLREVVKIPDNTYFRLKVMTFDNVPWVATLKKNEHYFPTVAFERDAESPEGWKRRVVKFGEDEGADGATEDGGEVLSAGVDQSGDVGGGAEADRSFAKEGRW
jgi:S1-C subfamily serine protease